VVKHERVVGQKSITEQFWGLVLRLDKLEWYGQSSKAACKGAKRTKCVMKNTHGNKITKKKRLTRYSGF